MERMHNCALGGKDNFASDREAVQKPVRLAPENACVSQDQLAVLGKAVRFAAEQGIRQFLDLGAGLPSLGSTHEVARLIQPEARVVYVDEVFAKSPTPMKYRSRDEVLRFFPGLDLVEPGLTTVTRWREEPSDARFDAAGSWTLAGVGRKS